MTKAVFGLANNEEHARRIVDHLLSANFSNEDISILYPETHKNRLRTDARGNVEYEESESYRAESISYRNERSDSIKRDESLPRKNLKTGNLTTEKHSKAPEGGVTGAAAGGILGGSLGLLAGIGALAIPGFGAFIAAGPIMAALSGSAIGGGVGLLLGALIGSGIPEYEAKKYEAGLKGGMILISVHTDSNEDIKHAIEIMKKEGAKDISSAYEKVKSKY